MKPQESRRMGSKTKESERLDNKTKTPPNGTKLHQQRRRGEEIGRASCRERVC